ncbi:MAG: polyprenyl synthetase family protein [Desulfopila sp.]|nr:polyprenyl synthetase family protein [Desulfopila sp.]
MLFPVTGGDYRKKIEWWFFQGYFNELQDEQQRRYFMVCLFRTSAKDRTGSHGHSYIASELHSGWSYSHKSVSRVDPHVVNIFIDSKNEIETNLNPHLVNAYCDEIVAYGPPAPIELIPSSPLIDASDNSIAWEDFHLFFAKKSLQLHVDLPLTAKCRFSLTPASPTYTFEYQRPSAAGSSFWTTCPRFDLKGQADGAECSGQVWFDYQRSNYGFFHADEDSNSVYGWDWLGLLLDNGDSLIVYVFRDLCKQTVVATDAYLMLADGSSRHFSTLTLHHHSYWQSKTTHIAYPSLSRLEIPELELLLDISPVVPDQEIPIFGVIRAIWEGVATVSGTLRGERVRGHARVEYHGYGYVFDTKGYLLGFTGKIDRDIEDFLPRELSQDWLEHNIGIAEWYHDPEGCTASLAEPAWDLLDRNGKHWRPICAKLFLESLEVPSDPYSQLIAAVSELNHTGSLIIDDIEDNSVIRRGEEAIHLRYGIDTAINAGNTLYFLPYLLLRDHPGFSTGQRLKAYELMVQMLCRCHIGQGLDIHWSKSLSPENIDRWLKEGFDQKILQMYAYKTGAQIEGVAEMACIIARAPRKVRSVYGALGRNFGVAFQIVDDIHNFNNSEGWSKIRGEDISSAKPTYVIIRALQMMDEGQKTRFLEIFCAEEMRSQDVYLAEAVELVAASGALQVCRQEAVELFTSSWQRFAGLACHNDAKIMLKMFFSSVLHYSYDV